MIIQEERNKLHKVVLLKLALWLKENKILKVHYTVVNSDNIRGRNKLFVCYTLSLKGKENSFAAF